MLTNLNNETFKALQNCVDDYMTRTGRQEINEMEANRELSRAGLLSDDEREPGKPLREVLMRLRDTDLLPRNIKQYLGSWFIRNSRGYQTRMQIYQF